MISSINITGLAYLLLSLGIGIFAWAAFKLWRKSEREQREQKKKNEVPKWLFYFLSIFTLLCFIAAIAGLFFNQNTMVLKLAVIVTCFLLALGSAVAMYLVFYLVPFRTSPWYGFYLMLIFGLITGFLTIFTPFTPHLEE